MMLCRNALKTFHTVCILLVTGFVLTACSKDYYAQDEPKPSTLTIVHVKQGDLVGFISDSGARVWRSIPYAMPPVGDLRWKAPRPPKGWTGVRSSLENPAWCTQLTGPLDKMYNLKVGEVVGSEDCLYLNIYAPSKLAEDALAPVMVWIHGGSNTWGRIADYDGAVLAEKYGVVVVSVQYRIGPFGWFSHPALRAEAVTEQDKAADFAILDLIAALKWVQGNITAFGGSAENVTIFGESAGAANVMALVSSPLSDGLFHRAAAQSGIPFSVAQDDAEKGTNGVKKGFVSSLEPLVGAEPVTADALRAMSAEDVIWAFAGADNRLNNPTMIADGVVVPRAPMATALIEGIKEKQIPFLFGSNRDESKFVYAFNPQFVNKRLWVFPEAKDKDIYDAVTEYTNHMWRALGVDGFAQKLRSENVPNAYSYRFDWDEQGTYYLSDMSYLIGAAHSLEVPFVLGYFNGLGLLSDISFHDDNAEGRLALSDAMMSYWAQFARSGNPGRGAHGDLPLWPAVTAEDIQPSLVFDTEQDGGITLNTAPLTVESILADFREDKRLKSAADKCMIASELEKYFGRGEARLQTLKIEVCNNEDGVS